MTTFWSLWITVLTLTCIALCAWILWANRKIEKHGDANEEVKTTGHVYDGIEEYNNPLPKWWFYLFLVTIVFGLIYLVLYPGLGSWKGLLNWTSVNELKVDQEKARADYVNSYDVYSKMSIEELSKNDEAMKIGFRLFANNCAVCHGSDAGGNYGFPNLTDDDWLHGGTVENIVATITHGRYANMPPWGEVIGDKGVANVTEYVLSLSGLEHDAAKAVEGKVVFDTTCSACHGMDAKGSIAFGAPNLTDDIWLYEGDRETISKTVRYGRVNRMPAQKELLRDDKIHLLSAYIYSLSR
ncbi:MAG: cytochrome-c oxidase, cbb3-type subunit III [Marinagarivorans sp.]|nr:cytochrome-c oxidase, cbb3-type subunit III [Marinagarivorans sp.]